MTVKNELPMALRAAYLGLHRRSELQFARHGVNSILSNLKLNGASVSFDEMLPFQGADLLIRYSGELKDDEMQLTRKVGEFAPEEFVAKKAK